MDEGLDHNTQSPFTGEEHVKYNKLMEASGEGLYEGYTTFSKLSFLLHLFHLKCMFHWSAESFNKLHELLLDAFPIIKEFPSSYYEGMKVINDLGLGYEKIHACPNDCMLYWGEFSEKSECHICHASRWKIVKGKEGDVSEKGKETCKKDDGIIRHPADGEAWKKFDEKYLEFAADPRSVRLGLASDGFNPYRLMNTNYSTWPVVLIPYNLPPWLCMKSSSFILSTIIPGKSGPGMDIDVYLQPLIHELKLLWLGVDAFDSYSGKNFKLRAALHSTINDFPAYAMLSGWSTRGYKACPSCTDSTYSYRFGEYGLAPVPASGTEVLKQQDKVKYVYGKSKNVPKKRGRKNADDDDDDADLVLWKKKRTLLGMGNSRDDRSAREALEGKNIKSHLWIDPQGDIPPAPYTMSNEEKERFLKVLKKLKVPDGYGSNLQRCVNLKKRKLINMKSHDNHILMQDILPVALRASNATKVIDLLEELSDFFKKICSTTIDTRELDAIQSKLVLTLCKMEIEFLPTFFTIMVHLIIHLVDEVRLGGPVLYRWMYPIER
ncbi:uncharacterized protein LOC110716190 [Chenopodium quinoa]|uniref:uncharacterized protein LOC110716190 n=1 Tax=Chenopodium quinoa TaxID=63459 RepID=UPI000B798522|nr:uncharacterized protein LOC110716190 [Chenopodium quinoa]